MPMKWFLDKAFTNDEAEVLKTIAKTANEGIWIIDIHGDTLFVNSKMAQMLGFSAEEMNGLGIYEFFCEECCVEIQKPRLLEDRHEICLKHKNGDTKVFSINSSTFLGDGGEYLGSLGMLSDITDIKTNAAELKRQKDILQSILEASNYLFFEKDILKAMDGVVSTIGSRFETARCFIYGKGLTQSFIETKLLQLAVYEDAKLPIAATNYDFFEIVNSKEHFANALYELSVNYFYEACDEGDLSEPMVSFAKNGIGYVYIVPLFVEKEIWGFFGASIAKGLGRLSESQKAALESMSKNLAFTIEKFFVARQLDNTKMELLSINQNLEAAAMMAIEGKLKIEQESIDRERELFAIKEKYHLLQQDDAYKKQIKILRDDLSHKRVGGFLFESFYKPLDILSGDIYGLIKVSKSASFIYIVDAMGKGLSASVTAVISASFINNLADEALATGIFDFRRIVESYQAFIKKQINDDELVCVVFVCIDESRNALEVANFSMPELLIEQDGGEIIVQKANNYPITSYFNGANIDRLECKNISKLLISSDGLKDTRVLGGGVYKEFLYSDFKSCKTKNIFLKKLFSEILNPDDDLTFVLVTRYEPKTIEKLEFDISPSIASVVECIDVHLRKRLALYFDDKPLMQIECALNELLMNALEHGVLNISYIHKHALLEAHIYEEFLEDGLKKLEEDDGKNIKVSLEEILLNGDKAVIIKVEDYGAGFDVGATLKALGLDKNVRFNGRGIIMSDNAVDTLFYNEVGNEANIIKFL
jgi:PAS domain S-box-containing protein